MEAAIYIPTNETSEFIKVPINPLPEASQVINILRAEIAPLEIWLRISAEYYKQDQVEDFKNILTQVVDPAIKEEYYKDSKLEKIAILNALASYYTQMGAVEKEKTKREEYFNQATYHFTRADLIDPKQPLTWIGKAVLLLSKGEVDRAETNFLQLIDLTSKDSTLPLLPVQLGHACILFNKGAYTKALETYQRVISANSNCAPAVRLGLGHCYFKLGRIERARQAFERVLALDPDNIEALIGLVLVYINTHDIPKSLEVLKRAHELAPTNAIVLNHLANHYFYRGDYDKVFPLSTAAYNNSEASQIRAEASYQLARAHHANDRWGDAHQNYHQAVLKFPDFSLAQFGLGQTSLHNGELEKSIQCFESVLERNPENPEALQVLGALYRHSTQSKNVDKIRNVLIKSTKLNPTDSSSWFELAQLLETTDASTALDAYQKGVSILKEEGSTVQPEVLNNMAVLMQMRGMHTEAEAVYLQVIEDSGFTLEDFKAVNTTTTYNLARLYEAMNRFARAKELYRGIANEHPTYIDCYLRLSALAATAGNHFEAGEWLKEALTIDPNHSATWALYASLHMSREQWSHAQKKFEQILEVGNKNDAYASISLGNIYFNAKYQQPEKMEKYLGNAESFYQRILSRNPNNIYAANGLGMIACDRGNLLLATDIFIKLRESSADVLSITLNLAHVYMQRGIFDGAIKLYDGCLKKCTQTKDLEMVYLYLSKAYYEARRYLECKQTLKKALHMSPGNMALWYNFALAIEQYALLMLDRPQRNLGEMSSLNKEVTYACHLLKSLLAQKPTTSKPLFDMKKCKSHSQSVSELSKRIGEELKVLEENEVVNAKKRERAMEEAIIKAKEREREEQEQREAEQARYEEEQRMAEEYRAREQQRIREKEDREREDRNDEEEESSSKKKKFGRRYGGCRAGGKADIESNPQEHIYYGDLCPLIVEKFLKTGYHIGPVLLFSLAPIPLALAGNVSMETVIPNTLANLYVSQPTGGSSSPVLEINQGANWVDIEKNLNLLRGGLKIKGGAAIPVPPPYRAGDYTLVNPKKDLMWIWRVLLRISPFVSYFMFFLGVANLVMFSFY
eukprot:gene17178-20466_t